MKRYPRLTLYVLSGLLLLVFTLSLASALTPYGNATSPDSVAYIDIATHIRNGNGWRATDFSLDAVHQPGTVENRLWPPLYPIFLAPFVQGALDVHGPALLSKILFFATAFLTFVILARRSHWLAALGAASLISLSIPMQAVFTYTWSESLFVPLMLLAALGSIEYLEAREGSETPRIIWMAVLTLALVLIAYSRYIGMALALLLPLTFALSKRDSLDKKLLLTSIPLYSAPVAHLVYGNYRLSGSFSGGARSASELTPWQNISHVLEAFATIFPSSPLALLLAVILALGFALAIGRPANQDRAPRPGGAAAGVIAGFVCICYLASMILLRSYARFDEIDVRLIAPAFLMLLMTSFLAASAIPIRGFRSTAAWALSFFFLISFAVTGYGLFKMNLEGLSAGNSSKYPARGGSSFSNVTPNPLKDRTRRLFSGIVGPEGLIVTRKAPTWRFISGVRTVELPDTLDHAVVEKFHRLPRGSVLMVEKDDSEAVLGQLKAGTDYSETTELGNLLLLRLVQSGVGSRSQ